MKHFSHHHQLQLSESEVKEEDETLCSGCEHSLSGSSYYTCTNPKCNFFLHQSCSKLPRQIHHHNSHPAHPLSLLPFPDYDGNLFRCDACGDTGSAFLYHCPACNFDLHVTCALLPETLTRPDHQHPVKLLYTSPYDEEYVDFCCSVCDEISPKGCWVYYCAECDYGTDLKCANIVSDEGTGKKGSESSDGGKKEEGGISALEAQRRLAENDLANRLLLQALDNANDYVGSSYKREKYYYYYY